MQNLLIIIHIISFLFALFLGFVVLFQRRNEASFLLSVICFSISVWVFGTLMILLNVGDRDKIIFWDRIVYVGVFYLSVLIYQLSLAFSSKKKNLILYLGYGIFTFFLVFNWTDYFTNGLYVYWWGGHLKAGILHHFFLFFFFFYASLLFYNFLKFYLSNRNSLEKSQAKYIIISMGFLITGSVSFLPAYGINFPPVGDLAVILFVSMVAYSIFKYRLMGIQFILSKIYLYSVAPLFVYLSFYLTFFIMDDYLGGPYSPLSFLIGIFIAIFFVFIFIRVLNYIQKTSDVIFYKGYNPRTVIKELSIKIGNIIDLEELSDLLSVELKKIMATDRFFIATLANNNQENEDEIKKSITLFLIKDKKFKEIEIEKNNPIYREIFKNKETIILDEIRQKNRSSIYREMKKMNIWVAEPLKIRDKIAGVLFLGEKMDRTAYTKEDIEFLEIISAQAAVALENAFLYKKTKDFNRKLRNEVIKATSKMENANEELRRANRKLKVAYEKLQKLDHAKSEFLSIASHQLRTPLTSIRGFLSMVLEGSYGKVSDKLRSVLEKVYFSSERLIKLVEDLLNISRIESGKMAFDFEKNDIKKLAEDLYSNMLPLAEKKNLSFEKKIPKKKIGEFFFDKGKIREVLSNLVDNAIKYTPKGKIQLRLVDQKDNVRIEIEDTGVGVRKGEEEYIFEKFQRGSEINNIYTEGVGIGLYIGRKIIKEHQGRIWGHSDGEGKGSVFVVELDKKFMPKGK